MIIRTVRSYVPDPLSRETPEGNSLTIPDMSMSLKTLVDRYTRSGQLGDVPMFEGVYDGDVDVPHFERMTPQQKLEYARNLQSSIAEMRADLVRKNKEAKDIEAKALEDISSDESVEGGNELEKK